MEDDILDGRKPNLTSRALKRYISSRNSRFQWFDLFVFLRSEKWWFLEHLLNVFAPPEITPSRSSNQTKKARGRRSSRGQGTPAGLHDCRLEIAAQPLQLFTLTGIELSNDRILVLAKPRHIELGSLSFPS